MRIDESYSFPITFHYVLENKAAQFAEIFKKSHSFRCGHQKRKLLRWKRYFYKLGIKSFTQSRGCPSSVNKATRAPSITTKYIALLHRRRLQSLTSKWKCIKSIRIWNKVGLQYKRPQYNCHLRWERLTSADWLIKRIRESLERLRTLGFYIFEENEQGEDMTYDFTFSR